MKLSKTSGASIAAAAAALVMSGAAFAPAAFAADDKVACYGANTCKGTGACKTAKNECKGKNGCKGQGFLQLTKADCTAKGGKLEAPKS
ncbi:MAG: hypothetical protein VX871_05860 [Pseudomonadota bacterium]|nr:hypothetical protein [Pseudomonadota bacterium]